MNGDEDICIATIKAKQLQDLLPLILAQRQGEPSKPLEALAMELLGDVVHALHRTTQ